MIAGKEGKGKTTCGAIAVAYTRNFPLGSGDNDYGSVSVHLWLDCASFRRNLAQGAKQDEARKTAIRRLLQAVLEVMMIAGSAQRKKHGARIQICMDLSVSPSRSRRGGVGEDGRRGGGEPHRGAHAQRLGLP